MIRCKIILLESFKYFSGALVLLKQKLKIGIVVGEVSGDVHTEAYLLDAECLGYLSTVVQAQVAP
jgi:hypothetical protein